MEPLMPPLMAARPARQATGRRATVRRWIRGLTLIEIAVALAVLAILASIGVPMFKERIARQRLVTTAELLAQDLADARFEAAQSGATLHIAFSAGSDWCYAVSRSAACGCHGQDACQMKVVRAADAPGVQMSQADDLAFDPAALEPDVGGAWLSSLGGEHRLQVGVTPLGRPKVCSTTGLAGYPAC